MGIALMPSRRMDRLLTREDSKVPKVSEPSSLAPETGTALPPPAQEALSPRARPSLDSQGVPPQLWTGEEQDLRGAGRPAWRRRLALPLCHVPAPGAGGCQGQPLGQRLHTSPHPPSCLLGVQVPWGLLRGMGGRPRAGLKSRDPVCQPLLHQDLQGPEPPTERLGTSDPPV